MPLVAHSNLPSFQRLKHEGEIIVSGNQAIRQDIREMHIGLLNMMPDAALEATERQFLRLVGGSNRIAQFYVHPFTLPEIKRGKKAQAYVDKYYETFEQLKEAGLDALIITGANVTQADLSQEVFWQPLIEIVDWALESVTSVICSCLATHAVMQFRHHQKRKPLGDKCWGVFQHTVVDRHHPLVMGVNTLFDVPHSRFNIVTREQFEQSGLHVLVESKAGVHLAVSEDLFRVVYFQGHPEYDTISLLKEYKREVIRFYQDELACYPPFPVNYFGLQLQAVLNEYQDRVVVAKSQGWPLPPFPEDFIATSLHNTWRDSAGAVINNWLGRVYMTTNNDRKLPFMENIDPNDPLGIRR